MTEGLSEELFDWPSEGPSQSLFEGPWEGLSEGPSESPSKGLSESLPYDGPSEGLFEGSSFHEQLFVDSKHLKTYTVNNNEAHSQRSF